MCNYRGLWPCRVTVGIPVLIPGLLSGHVRSKNAPSLPDPAIVRTPARPITCSDWNGWPEIDTTVEDHVRSQSQGKASDWTISLDSQ